MGGTGKSSLVIASCFHYPSGNKIRLLKKPQDVHLLSDGHIQFGGAVDRIGAISRLRIKDIQKLEFKLSTERRSAKSDTAVALYAIAAFAIGFFSMPFSAFWGLSPAVAILLLLFMNSKVSEHVPPPTLEIDTKGGKINVSTQSIWGRYYQRLVQILVSVYIFAILLFVLSLFGVDWVTDDSELTAFESIMIYASVLPAMYWVYHVPVLFLTSKGGKSTHQSKFDRFCIMLDQQFNFANDVLNKGSEEPEEDTLSQQIESLRQQFLVHQIRLQFIQDQINDLSKIPTASSGITVIRGATERILKAVCKAHDFEFQPKRANLSNLRDKMRKLTTVPAEVIIAIDTIRIYGNHSTHDELSHPEEEYRFTLLKFQEVLQWYVDNYV